MFPAGFFFCDNCGTKVYFDIPVFEEDTLPEEVKDAIPVPDNMDKEEDGVIYSLPDIVTCSACCSQYEPYENPADIVKIINQNNGV